MAAGIASTPGPEGGAAAREPKGLTRVTVGGHAYVCGLHWERIGASHGALRVVKDRGMRLGFHAAAIYRSTAATQAGFSRSKGGVDADCRSLAVAIALVAGPDALVAVRLREGLYALTALRGGAIASGSDMAGSLEEVSAEFEQLTEDARLQGKPYERIVAPAEFGAEAESLDVLAAIAALKKGPEPLIALGKSAVGGRQKLIAVAIVAVIVLGAGWAFHIRSVREAQAAAARAAEAAKAAAEQLAAIKKAQAPPPDPWGGSPTASALVASCGEQMSKLPIAVGGWLLSGAECGYGHMSATYSRQGNATVADLIFALKSTLGLLPDIKADGNTAGITVGFDAPPKSDEQIEATGDATTAFISHFQALGLSVPLTTVPPPVGPDPKNPLPPPPWKTFTFQVSATPITAIRTEHHASQLFSGLDLRGLRVDSIALERVDETPFLTWTVGGHLYAR
ncbi:type 4b pilus protein PilO2 [Rhodanobacter sp. FW106-PBR-R2A-1-13]|uniref:type 4b pilus protein PilO2 n=1 Tax=Rhodanobacter sp. FW106-PBR-R2A-1-13 TaxID=3454845 RepID=UPI0034E52A80